MIFFGLSLSCWCRRNLLLNLLFLNPFANYHQNQHWLLNPTITLPHSKIFQKNSQNQVFYLVTYSPDLFSTFLNNLILIIILFVFIQLINFFHLIISFIFLFPFLSQIIIKFLFDSSPKTTFYLMIIMVDSFYPFQLIF